MTTAVIAYCQPPAGNPYTALYGAQNHWTNSLKWNNVVNVTSVKGLLRDGNKVDSVIIQRVMKQLASKGGGVLFFPAGTYYFNYSLRLVGGVIIRGEDTKGITDARTAGFDPPTKFEFPMFKPSFEGAGTPHSDFKCIYADTIGIKNVGLVNLNINRAAILFFPGGYRTVSTLQGNTHWGKYFHDNIIILGIRQNNAVIPSPEIPNERQIEAGHSWQRWPYPYIGNINVFVSHNCVIANCRLNDAITDDFDQPDYIDEFYSKFTGSEARFFYADHPGICVNFLKIVTSGQTGKASGKWGPYGFWGYTSRDEAYKSLDSICEPSLFFHGKREVIGNYILTHGRHDKILTISETKTDIRDNIEVSMDSATTASHVDERGMRSLYNSTSADVLAYFESKMMITSQQDTLHYRLMKPASENGNKKYPVVLFMHSEDLFGMDNQKQLAFFIPKFCTPENRKNFPCYVVAPQEDHLLGAWVESEDDKKFTKTLILTKQLLDNMMTQPDVDTSRIYVIGVSRGGTGAFNLASKYPGLFAALATLDGLEHHFSEENLSSLKQSAVWTAVPRRYGYLSLFLISRLNIVRLKRVGGDAVFNLLEGSDRQSMINEIYKDPKFFPWLFSKEKKSLLN